MRKKNIIIALLLLGSFSIFLFYVKYKYEDFANYSNPPKQQKSTPVKSTSYVKYTDSVKSTDSVKNIEPIDVVVTGLHPKTTADELINLFSQYGSSINVKLGKNMAIITMNSFTQRDKIISELNGTQFKGNTIFLK